MVLMGEIFELIDFFSFTAWFFYGLTMFSLIVLRITQKERPRPYKVGSLSFDRGIKHDFPFINIRKAPREVLKTEGPRFSTFPRDLANVNE